MEEDKVVESIPTETMESDDDFFAEIDEEVIKEYTCDVCGVHKD